MNPDVLVHLYVIIRQEPNRGRLVERRANVRVYALVQYVQLVKQVFKVWLLDIKLYVLSDVLK